MIDTFVFQPLIGCLPITFASTRAQVDGILGSPVDRQSSDKQRKDIYAYTDEAMVVINLNGQELVEAISFTPGIALQWNGSNLMERRDLIEFLLQYDESPLEALGTILFRKIGLATGNEFQSDDDDIWMARTITCFGPGGYDDDTVSRLGFKPYVVT